ncbi:hypothetical protein EVAR_33382_1 [Eumeta japonica]|uniref:Uncharacterized protein n=1 Tax=Eumeta variegata TaxID=151549 RepID=A0A4C1X441_EUMVA|nr:hypothetical protein EVAR_33382_1 [Eumeta japonica]
MIAKLNASRYVDVSVSCRRLRLESYRILRSSDLNTRYGSKGSTSEERRRNERNSRLYRKSAGIKTDALKPASIQERIFEAQGKGLTMEPEGEARNSIMKQRIQAVFGLVEIVLRCSLTMNDFRV